MSLYMSLLGDSTMGSGTGGEKSHEDRAGSSHEHSGEGQQGYQETD